MNANNNEVEINDQEEINQHLDNLKDFNELEEEYFKEEEKEVKQNTSTDILSLFNNSLISLMNKLQYILTFIKPETNENSTFLIIQYIQTESQDICLYDNSFNKTKMNLIDMKYQQIEIMMEIIQTDTTILFLFDIDELKQIMKNDNIELFVKINKSIIEIKEFIDKYIDTISIETITKYFNSPKHKKNFELNQFSTINEKEKATLLSNKIFKTNDDRMLDEWNKIMIYCLLMSNYSVILTNEAFNYLKTLEKIESIQQYQNKQINNWKQYQIIDQYISNNQNNKFDQFLLIQTIEINRDKIYLSQMKEKQLKQLISIITNQKDQHIKLIFNENVSKRIPMFIQLKESDKKVGNKIERISTYSSSQFIKQFDVNKIIENLINNQFKRNEILENKSDRKNSFEELNEYDIENISDDLELIDELLEMDNIDFEEDDKNTIVNNNSYNFTNQHQNYQNRMNYNHQETFPTYYMKKRFDNYNYNYQFNEWK